MTPNQETSAGRDGMSTYYQERMEADLGEIRDKVREVSDLVEGQVTRAVDALFDHDRARAAAVVLGDREVNRRIGQIDALCHAFIVRHAPTERYLRRASAVLRLDVALERVGDYASSIGREVGRISAPLPADVAGELRSVADHARDSLAEALRAFRDGDEALARGGGEITDEEAARVFDCLLELGHGEDVSLADVFGFTHVLNLLMRVAEQSENIREQTLFAITGEVPSPRAFRVLFVDERNARASQLAEAYARKTFPGSGTYRSAGWRPAEALDPELVDFLAGRGVDASGARPKALSGDGAEPEHVVVVMSPEGRAEIEPVPFRTTLVTWKLDDSPAGGDLERLYDALGRRVDELMRTLAGPEAA